MLKVSITALAFAGVTGIAFAGPIPYPDSGTVNTATYSFTATSTGDLVGYFGGSGASYDEQVGLLVNGTLTAAGFGLDDHSTPVGTAFNFGTVTAGDTLVFVDQVNNGAAVVDAYSDPSMNVAYDASTVTNHQHIYSTSAAADQVFSGSPAGTYIGFEDLSFPGSDFNYFDDTFVFTNVSTVTGNVPDGASTLALVGMGLAAVFALRRRVKAFGAV
jgi:VPDSG-CTERM motif